MLAMCSSPQARGSPPVSLLLVVALCGASWFSPCFFLCGSLCGAFSLSLSRSLTLSSFGFNSAFALRLCGLPVRAFGRCFLRCVFVSPLGITVGWNCKIKIRKRDISLTLSGGLGEKQCIDAYKDTSASMCLRLNDRNALNLPATTNPLLAGFLAWRIAVVKGSQLRPMIATLVAIASFLNTMKPCEMAQV